MTESHVAATGGIALDEAAVQELKARVRGDLLRPGDDGYDAARRVWNGMIDRRPALIARCAGVADVVAAVRFAREHQLLVSVRGGGHSVPGFSVCDRGLMIDLSRMRAVRVDPAGLTARAEGGATWGDFDHETQAFGLATTGGIARPTGIAGLTLGGGHGFLMRKHGLACDNLVSVDLVTAEGRLLTASADQHADLFWGLRGGGGNFGVATSFEYRLHPVGPILGGLLIYPLAHARDVLRRYRDSPAPPRTSWAPPPSWAPCQTARRRRSSWSATAGRSRTASSCCARCAPLARWPIRSAQCHTPPCRASSRTSTRRACGTTGSRTTWRS
jgi:hypothetical protein